MNQEPEQEGQTQGLIEETKENESTMQVEKPEQTLNGNATDSKVAEEFKEEPEKAVDLGELT